MTFTQLRMRLLTYCRNAPVRGAQRAALDQVAERATRALHLGQLGLLNQTAVLVTDDAILDALEAGDTLRAEQLLGFSGHLATIDDHLTRVGL